MRALSYASVSTDEQATEQKNSIPQQLADNAAVAEARDWTITETIIIDGHSRNYEYLHDLVAACAEYARFVRLIQERAVDVVLCRDWDRIGRTQYLVQEVSHVAIRAGVQFYVRATPETIYSPEEYRSQVDASTTHLLRSLHGYGAEQDVRRLQAKYRAGMIGRVNRGLSMGPASVPYGYRYVGRNVPYEVEPTEAPWVVWMFERRAEGWSHREIADGLNTQGAPRRRSRAWRQQNIRQMLANRYYAGFVRFREHQRPGAHERILSDDLWERAQRVNRNRSVAKSRQVWSLSGLARCALCGWGMNVYTNQAGNVYLRCNRYSGTGGCQSYYLRLDTVEAYLLDAVRSVLSDPDAYTAMVRQQAGSDGHAERTALLKRAIAEADAQAKRVLTAYIMGHMADDDMASQSERIKRERASLVAELNALTTTAERAERMLADMVQLADLVGELDHLEPQALNALYRRLMARVEFRPHASPHIVWAWDADA